MGKVYIASRAVRNQPFTYRCSTRALTNGRPDENYRVVSCLAAKAVACFEEEET
jgi:hypothetical protein